MTFLLYGPHHTYIKPVLQHPLYANKVEDWSRFQLLGAANFILWVSVSALCMRKRT